MLLLAMFQKFRLIRERNQLQLDIMRDDSKLTRIQNSQEKKQKYYAAEIQKVKSNAERSSSLFAKWIQQQSGLGTAGLNLGAWQQYGGISNFVLGALHTSIQAGLADSNTQAQYAGLDSILEYYAQGARFAQGKDAQGNACWTIGGQLDANGNMTGGMTVTQEQYQAFNQLLYNANFAQNMKQQEVQQISSTFEQNASIFVEARIAELEAEQDQALEPLAYEQTMLEMTLEARKLRLERIKASLESYNQMAQDGAQEMAPKFGLS